MQIRQAKFIDWEAIRKIYLEGIRTGNATFEIEENIPDGPTWFTQKIAGSVNVAIDNEENVLGWSALSRVSSRKVYKGVAEVSVYVGKNYQRKGIGNRLLENTIELSKKSGIWTLQAGIFPENQVSIDMHLKLGFRVVGVREKLGQLHGDWRDVVLLERRSKKI